MRWTLRTACPQPRSRVFASAASCIRCRRCRSAKSRRSKARYQAQAAFIKGRHNQKPHLLFTWLDALVRDPRILDAVESLLGPDLLCWGSQFFAKPAGDAAYVSWHQDATYWGLSSPDVVTAWVALTPSTRESGCMQVVPGTHRAQVPHEDTLRRRQPALARPGGRGEGRRRRRSSTSSCSRGRCRCTTSCSFHGSEPNSAARPRIGFAIRYVPTARAPALGEPRQRHCSCAASTRFGHFEPEQSPEADLHPDAVARHSAVIDRQLRILYAGARAARQARRRSTRTSRSKTP